MIKGCIFDLDGTLANTLLDLAYTTNEVLKMHDLPIHEISKYNLFVGNGVKKLMMRALGENHLDLLDICLDEFYCLYDQHLLDNTKAYPGIDELIDKLYNDGILLSVVTNKPHHNAVKLSQYLFPDKFVSIYGNQDLYPVKPNPASLHLALNDMHLNENECIFIGDSNVDVETAKNGHMKCIGVAWGFRGREELATAGADYVVDTALEIAEIIDENRS
ncbi:MAG: HAD family hydrolase [Erysipelotrichaceae bacterium]|nr:HAD family hydrolase [Erysipelotrichaceae bacterium]